MALDLLICSLALGVVSGLRLGQKEGPLLWPELDFESQEEGPVLFTELDFEGSYATSATDQPILVKNQPACSPEKDTRVALLVFGMSRQITAAVVQNSIEEHIIKPMQQSGIGGLKTARPDIFAHIKVGSNNKSDVAQAMLNLQATDYQIVEGNGKYGNMGESTEQFISKPQCFKGKHMRPDRLQGPMGRDWSIQEVHLLMEKHEKALKKDYSAVIFARADLLYRQDVPLNDINCKIGHVHHDFFAIIPREHSHRMRDILKDFYLSSDPYGCGSYKDSEDIWAHAVAKWRHDAPDFPATYTRDLGPGGKASEGGRTGKKFQQKIEVS